jgi:hypothetical protein
VGSDQPAGIGEQQRRRNWQVAAAERATFGDSLSVVALGYKPQRTPLWFAATKLREHTQAFR